MKKSTSPVRRRRNGGRKPISSMNGRPGKQRRRTERDRRACGRKHPAPKAHARETKQEPAKKPCGSLAPKRRPPRENSRETAEQRTRYRECVAKDNPSGTASPQESLPARPSWPRRNKVCGKHSRRQTRTQVSSRTIERGCLTNFRQPLYYFLFGFHFSLRRSRRREIRRTSRSASSVTGVRRITHRRKI